MTLTFDGGGGSASSRRRSYFAATKGAFSHQGTFCRQETFFATKYDGVGAK